MAKAQPLPTSPYPHTNARLPPIITSVARMIPSGNECLQPYTLSNLDLVTQSFTLMAGNKSSPLAAISFSRCTPVVLFAHTLALSSHACVLGFVSRNRIFEQLENALVFGIVSTRGVWQRPVLGKLGLELLAFVHEQGGITAVVDQLVTPICAWHCHHLLCAPPILWQCLALPRKHR